MKTISVNSMRNLDAKTIAAGTPGETLMERAGRGLFDELLEFVETLPKKHAKRVAIIAGKGNNGGDGYVLARLLATETALPVAVFSICPPAELKGDAALNAQRLPATVPVQVCPEQLPSQALLSGTIVVDALLGTGLSGELRPPYPVFIKQLNDSRLPVVAVDIPSGLDGDTGEPLGDAVVADLTVTMALPKYGLFCNDGREFCGRLRCVDIGVAPEHINEIEAYKNAIFAQDIAPLLSRRPRNSHKNTFGHTFVIGGSQNYTGAPLLAACAALRVGSGLVTVAAPASVMQRMKMPMDALIAMPLPEGKAGPVVTDTAIDSISDLEKQASAILFGPGIGRSPHVADALEAILALDVPIVIDADGLQTIAANGERFPMLEDTVLTPHPGEMAALLKGFNLDPALLNAPHDEQAEALANYCGAVVVLKGMQSVVAPSDDDCWFNSTGTPALATAGTGDVLAGMIAGFIAQGVKPLDAAKAGVFIHGLASEITTMPQRSFTADDLLNVIPDAIAEISPVA